MVARWKRYDPVLWLIVAAFTIFELLAHFVFHNQGGTQTASNKIEAFENKYGLPARVLVAAAVIALGAHLEGAF